MDDAEFGELSDLAADGPDDVVGWNYDQSALDRLTARGLAEREEWTEKGYELPHQRWGITSLGRIALRIERLIRSGGAWKGAA